jgi:hypothetical protein|nr:hypothetical protein [Neorhizobium tomejilense]
MTSKPLTPAERAWIDANPEAVRALIASNTAAPATPTRKFADPAQETADYLIKWMKNHVGKIETSLERDRKTLARLIRMAEDPQSSEDSRSFGKEMLEDERPELEEKIAASELHIEAIKAKIDVLSKQPVDLMLPIGTVVRFVGVPAYANSLALTDDRKSYPVAGTVGVVTRLHRSDEYPLGVSVRDTYEDGYGDRYYPDCDRFPTFRADVGMFEVIGYGLLPDGEEYRGYGFHQTHVGSLRGDTPKPEMVLESNGHFWRFHDFKGTQSIEALQAYESMEEMSWISGPSEDYASIEIGRSARPSPKP